MKMVKYILLFFLTIQLDITNSQRSNSGDLHFGPGGLRAPCVLACAMRACVRHAYTLIVFVSYIYLYLVSISVVHCTSV